MHPWWCLQASTPLFCPRFASLPPSSRALARRVNDSGRCLTAGRADGAGGAGLQDEGEDLAYPYSLQSRRLERGRRGRMLPCWCQKTCQMNQTATPANIPATAYWPPASWLPALLLKPPAPSAPQPTRFVSASPFSTGPAVRTAPCTWRLTACDES